MHYSLQVPECQLSNHFSNLKRGNNNTSYSYRLTFAEKMIFCAHNFCCTLISSCSDHADEHRYGVVQQFVGHGVGRVFHSAPVVLHYSKFFCPFSKLAIACNQCFWIGHSIMLLLSCPKHPFA